MIPTAPEARDILAGEYVLGQLDEAQTRQVEAAIAADPDMAARVQVWEARLLPALDASVRPAILDPALWPRIERALSARSGSAARRDAISHPRRFWNSAPAWRAATALATAAAILLAVFPVRERAPAEPQTRFFAVLQTRDASGGDTGPGWLIQITEDGTVRSVPLGRIDPGQNRALQLWTLWDQARGPVSLGILPPGGAVRLPRESLPQIGGGQLFEITLEPQAGSPTGRPTGRILFIGRAAPAVSQAL